jgi:hypothetical protein
MENYHSLEEALDNLRKRGYEADFSPDADCLYCEDLDIRLDPEDFHIDEVYRFADDSSPDKNPTLYAITSATGVKGTLVDVSNPIILHSGI